ncbi:MAG: non-canonical purine NTP pyrophosphatase, RdgB/HAM1 family [Thermoprotei archaeon]|nr:MAG: non-canonical purine NTP pyrophosphatase, RdgB/HAM1 family [Thermoprotei archaeon]
MINLAFITGNKHKVMEASILLKEYNIEVTQVSSEKVEIQSERLEEIVRYALESVRLTNRHILIEDAGLFIDSLNGFPGPYSSFAYKTIGVQGVLKLMEGMENRGARFVSVAGIKTLQNEVAIFRGEVEGVITHKPRGTKGFGFDPIFVPKGSSKTFAEMEVKEKNVFSHRAKALRRLAEWILGRRR